MRQAKRKFESQIARNCKSDPKVFWTHIRRRLKTKDGISPLLEGINDKNSMKFKDEEKANILQKQFASVFTREPPGEIPQLKERTDVKLDSITVTRDMVQTQILNLNANKSCGPDEINYRLLIELADYISLPLTLLFNKTLKVGEIPVDWKRANITPIYKKGAKCKAENYRPISLTSIICKIMESFIKDIVMDHLRTNNLLSSKQYGFVSGRSTAVQLLSYLDKCIEKIVNGNVVDTIYLDFAKAFDSVPHRRLLGKLEAYGIQGPILNWIKALLSDRNQVVNVNGALSSIASVLSGIPQGSVLGPVLFIIYINDIPEVVVSDIYLFADDTKILQLITKEEDSISLQHDLENLKLWSDKWLLKFNSDKCHILTLGKFENIKHTHHYSMDGVELEHVSVEKDLGVLIDEELIFEEHIMEKVKKANAIVGLIRRSFSYLDGRLFKKLFTTFVRPHLEYCAVVWNPHFKKHIKIIENVQVRATKLIDGFNKLNYTERLQRLGLPTLIYRRARGDMIELYKHFNTYDKTCLSTSFQPRSRSTRSHDRQLIWNIPKDGAHGVQTNSFYYRSVNIWNTLPGKVVTAPNINAFKNEIDKHWDNHPMKYNFV